jgi:hypothetical protein
MKYLLLLLLVGCASTPKETKKPTIINPKDPVGEVEMNWKVVDKGNVIYLFHRSGAEIKLPKEKDE